MTANDVSNWLVICKQNSFPRCVNSWNELRVYGVVCYTTMHRSLAYKPLLPTSFIAVLFYFYSSCAGLYSDRHLWTTRGAAYDLGDLVLWCGTYRYSRVDVVWWTFTVRSASLYS